MVATWNVRTMVEDVGDVHICRKYCRKHDASNDSQSVNCKLDLLQHKGAQAIWCVSSWYPGVQVVWQGSVVS